MRYRIAALAAGAVLALSVLGSALPASAVTVRGCGTQGCDVTPSATITVFHKATGPGGQLIPWVRASMHLYVLRPPRSGVIGKMYLEYRRGITGRWQHAGSEPGWHGPWHHGWTPAETIEYPCNYNHSYWRIRLPFDVIRYNGQGDRGTYYYPPGSVGLAGSRSLGKRLTCVVLDGAHS